MMVSVIRTIRLTNTSALKRVKHKNIRKYNNDIWGTSAIDLLDNDFDKIQELKNNMFELPFVINEIPPPFCPRCCKHIKNKCLFSPLDDISIDDFNLTKNPNLTIRCPVFGEIDNNEYN